MANETKQKFIQTDSVSNDIFFSACGADFVEAGQKTLALDFIFLMLIYISSGSGTVEINDERFEARAGLLFCCQSKAKVIISGGDKGLSYQWIDFGGRKVKEMLEKAGMMRRRGGADMYASLIGEHFAAVLRLAVSNPEAQGQFSEGGFLSELYGILFECGKTADGLREGAKGVNGYVKSAVEYIQSHYAEEISLSVVADHIGLNPQYMSNLFKKHTGITMSQHIIDVRISNACRLFKNQMLNITEVAYMTGYKDVLYFSKEFKKKTGYTPSLYRKYAIINRI